ncbi:VOC family protein [Jeotgalibacillus proteolyticus]|uniref:Glyoxalase n=1 Tax=Jeotgalibacillus proteolyticus TaxID=2082395 RepID=A0A2S5G7Y6_9BACL|nr:VOC family protein [Jeotgalibacillus proteolyticus]PPA69053.1 glyoxalase [Jeotgalibacillus proteolyticus]
MYKGIHHVSIIVTDIERSMRFYEEVLGFERSNERPGFDFDGAWYQIGETQLHLIAFKEGKTLRGTTSIDSNDGHFAIRVEDIEGFIKRMEENQVAILNKPVNKTDWHQVFISDPDGNLIEFNQ